MISMPKLSLTVSTEIFDWLTANTDKKRGAKQEYIRSLLNMVQNGVLLLNSADGLVIHSTTKTDNWLPIEQLRRKKKISSAVPIYPIEHMSDLMKELKDKLANINIKAETKDTILDMRKEQQKIVKAMSEEH